jgi:transcriptional regulator with XRE-family HTH domain
LKNILNSTRHRALVELLIQKRLDAHMTQAELAERLGEYQSFVARLESGQRRVDVVEFIELSEVLHFDVAKAINAIAKT